MIRDQFSECFLRFLCTILHFKIGREGMHDISDLSFRSQRVNKFVLPLCSHIVSKVLIIPAHVIVLSPPPFTGYHLLDLTEELTLWGLSTVTHVQKNSSSSVVRSITTGNVNHCHHFGYRNIGWTTAGCQHLFFGSSSGLALSILYNKGLNALLHRFVLTLGTEGAM